MAKLILCNDASIFLLVVLSFISYCKASSDVPQEDVRASTSENTTRPEVRIPHGRIRGISMVTRRRRDISGFRGIPFAQPPVGSLRFKGPIAEIPWNGTLDASIDPTPCPQAVGGPFIGDENCLYLNVYTPRLPASKNSTLLPVMVYVYGGGFMKGSITSLHYGPYFLLDKDVVLVVPNYRLGVLGFLSTGDEVAPGNYGMKDLVRALEWNRDNIQYFGGDPSQVTLVGGSSGAISVELLMLSNSTDGLFHRYITQSGSALSTEIWRPRKSFAERAHQIGKHFGCPTNTSTVLVECLRSIDTIQLVNADSVFYIWKTVPMNIWGPTVEPEIEGAFLTRSPADLFAAGQIRDLPWLSSLTPEEGVLHRSKLYKNADVFQSFLDNIDIILPSILQYDSLVDNVTAYTAALKSYYLNDLTADKSLLLKNITQLIGDASFNHPLITASQKHLVHAKSPHYFCSFEYKGTFSHSYRLAGGTVIDWGVVHGDENLYLFQNPSGYYGPPEYRMNTADWKMVDIMVQLWTSFVINGMPTMPDSNSGIIWEPYSPRQNYLRIGSNSDVSLEVEHDFFKDRSKFWEELHVNTSWK